MCQGTCTATYTCTHANTRCDRLFLSQCVTLHLVDLCGMSIMTLLPNYPSMPVKDPDNLLMARVVVCLIAQLINLGVEKSAPRQLRVPSTVLCMKLDPVEVKWETCCYQRRRGNGGSSSLCPRDSVVFGRWTGSRREQLL